MIKNTKTWWEVLRNSSKCDLKSSDEFVPPKPKEFDMAALMHCLLWSTQRHKIIKNGIGFSEVKYNPLHTLADSKCRFTSQRTARFISQGNSIKQVICQLRCRTYYNFLCIFFFENNNQFGIRHKMKNALDQANSIRMHLEIQNIILASKLICSMILRICWFNFVCCFVEKRIL